MDPSAEENLNCSYSQQNIHLTPNTIHLIGNHNLFSPYVQFRKRFHLPSLTVCFLTYLLYPLFAGCADEGKIAVD